MKRHIDDLRDHLFETLEALKDQNNPMDIERAKAIAGVAQVIINSAKVEVHNAQVNGGVLSGFLDATSTHASLPKNTVSPQPGVLIHKLQG